MPDLAFHSVASALNQLDLITCPVILEDANDFGESKYLACFARRAADAGHYGDNPGDTTERYFFSRR
jgi:hypothetical protein